MTLSRAFSAAMYSSGFLDALDDAPMCEVWRDAMDVWMGCPL